MPQKKNVCRMETRRTEQRAFRMFFEDMYIYIQEFKGKYRDVLSHGLESPTISRTLLFVSSHRKNKDYVIVRHSNLRIYWDVSHGLQRQSALQNMCTAICIACIDRGRRREQNCQLSIQRMYTENTKPLGKFV